MHTTWAWLKTRICDDVQQTSAPECLLVSSLSPIDNTTFVIPMGFSYVTVRQTSRQRVMTLAICSFKLCSHCMPILPMKVTAYIVTPKTGQNFCVNHEEPIYVTGLAKDKDMRRRSADIGARVSACFISVASRYYDIRHPNGVFVCYCPYTVSDDPCHGI